MRLYIYMYMRLYIYIYKDINMNLNMNMSKNMNHVQYIWVFINKYMFTCFEHPLFMSLFIVHVSCTCMQMSMNKYVFLYFVMSSE
jgi:hypothetical protein